MSDDHDHDHDAQPHPGVHPNLEFSERAKRILAMEDLLVEKGVLTRDEILRGVDELGTRSASDGARVVARTWVDPEFKKRLVADPKSAVQELGFTYPEVSELTVVENTDEVHHLVVCTLCSCYPGALLGLPPDWYKSLAYRSRAVSDPRGVMREFGLELEEGVAVKVLDSTADMRYMVLPRRPAGTEALSEEELETLVSRDSMIGVTDALKPEPAGA